MLLCAILSSVVSVITMYAEKALFIVCAGVLALIFIMMFKRVKGEIIFTFLCVLIVALSGFFTAVKIDSVKNYDRTTCDGEFVVVENPVNHGEYYSATIEVLQSDVLSKGDKIAVTYNNKNLSYAQKFKASVSVSSLENHKTRNNRYSNKIFVKGYISEIVETTGEDGALSVIDNVRSYIKNKIFAKFGYTRAATVLALVTGDKSYFTDEFYSNVKSAGVAHIMVVSGMHLSVVVALFLFLLDRFIYNRYIRAFAIVTVAFALMIICGFTMSILRAGISYLFLAISLIINRQTTPENTLGTAVTVILISNPFAIFNIGFELSVLSTLSILVVAFPLIKYLSKIKFLNKWYIKGVLSSVIISISALIFTAPVTIYTFGYISNLSVITNLLLSPASSLALILCVLGLLLPFLENFLFWACEWVAFFINNVINDFGSMPNAVTALPRFTAFVFLAVVIIILCVLLACKKRKDMLKLKEVQNLKQKERSKKVIWQ